MYSSNTTSTTEQPNGEEGNYLRNLEDSKDTCKNNMNSSSNVSTTEQPKVKDGIFDQVALKIMENKIDSVLNDVRNLEDPKAFWKAQLRCVYSSDSSDSTSTTEQPEQLGKKCGIEEKK
jgi:hypothetical protein